MKGEEAAVLRAFRRLRSASPNALLILAPRHPERFLDVARMSREEGLKTLLRTELPIDAEPRGDVVIVDTIGELATIYQIATIVFVGGSLVATGGHNILEPAVFGKPIVFGPHMENFAEIAAAFVANGAGIQVHGERELDDTLAEPDDRSGAPRALGCGSACAWSKPIAARKAKRCRCWRSFCRRIRRRRIRQTSGRSDPLLDLLYAQAVGARRRWYERHPHARHHLQRPVISIGNLSVGGTGKTPLVASVVEWLLARGERPAILSRGYGRRLRDIGVVVVSDGATVTADLDSAGDEPLMLARLFPDAVVCVCEDRHLAGVVAERRLGATVHVLDDGFQHVALARDLDVLVTAPGEIVEWTRAAVRPAARERVGRQPGRSRGVCWRRREYRANGSVDARREPVLRRQTRDGPTAERRGVCDRWRGSTRTIFSGAPRRRRSTCVARRRFAITIATPQTTCARSSDAARAAGAAVVATTEKDAVRLEPLGALPFTVCAVRLRLELEPPTRSQVLLDAALARARNAA